MPTQSLTTHAELWKERINQWQTSGLSLASWSRENNLVYSQCIYWKLRFLGPQKKKPLNPEGFYELSHETTSSSGVSIEANGIRIHLESNFDSSVLRQCLAFFGGKKC